MHKLDDDPESAVAVAVERAAALAAAGRDEEAVDGYLDVLPELERRYPYDRWALVNVLDALSRCLSRARRVDEMAVAQRRAIQVADGAAPDPAAGARLRIALGDRFAMNTRDEAAGRAYAQATEYAELHFGTEHELTLEAAEGMAAAAAALGRHGDALRIYRWSVPAAECVFGPGSPEAARVREGRASATQQRRRRLGSLLGVVLIVVVLAAIVWAQLG